MSKHRLMLWTLGLIVLLIGTVSGVIAAPPSQEPDEIEAIALRIHLHNTRSTDFTVWPGGDLGTNIGVKPTWPLGTPLEDWEFPGLGEGQESLRLDDLTRPTLINIWASWCPPCTQEFPLLTQIALTPDVYSYDVVFVNSLDEEFPALQFLSGQRQGIRSVSDPDGMLLAMVGAPGIPTSILIDGDHNVIALQVGNFTSAQAPLFEILARDPDAYPGTFDPTKIEAPAHFVEIAPFDPADAQPITVGEAVDGTITAEDVQQVYTFEGHAGDVVTVKEVAEPSLNYADAGPGMAQWAAGRDLEPYVVLLGPDGEYRCREPRFSV